MPLVWVDIETTGLEPSRNVMLELGMIATTNDLEIIDTFHAVLGYQAPTDHLDEVVRTMHANNGLWDECRGSRYEASLAQHDAVAWLIRNEVSACPMAGSSVGFDRAFLKEWMPRLEERFHYRNADLSSVREFARRWRRDLVEPTPQALHRAIPDLHDTLELARFYRDNVFVKA